MIHTCSLHHNSNNRTVNYYHETCAASGNVNLTQELKLTLLVFKQPTSFCNFFVRDLKATASYKAFINQPQSVSIMKGKKKNPKTKGKKEKVRDSGEGEDKEGDEHERRKTRYLSQSVYKRKSPPLSHNVGEQGTRWHNSTPSSQ